MAKIAKTLAKWGLSKNVLLVAIAVCAAVALGCVYKITEAKTAKKDEETQKDEKKKPDDDKQKKSADDEAKVAERKKYMICAGVAGALAGLLVIALCM